MYEATKNILISNVRICQSEAVVRLQFGPRFKQILTQRLWVFLLALSIFSFSGNAQSTILPFGEYMQQVRQNHPIGKQAELLESQANANQRVANGNFDPKLFGDYEHKTFDGKNYFRIGEGGVKVPSWFGTEFKAGYNWNNGVFLNPSDNLPTAGQAVLGGKITLLQGLLIDDRRAALKQARIFREMTEVQRQQLFNDVLFEAAKAYWDWSFAYEIFEIQKNALEFSETRLQAVVSSFEQGDKPAIDTLESKIQVQTRQLQLQEAELFFQNTRLLLSNFLWTENEVPLELTKEMSPERLPLDLSVDIPLEVITVQNDLMKFHPDLRSYQLKLSGLEIERRLKAEKLKPKLSVEYNLLAERLDFQNGDKISGGENNPALLFQENYKWGIEFSMPLFLRQARGNLQLAEVKMATTNLQLSQKRQEVKNKIEAYLQQMNLTQSQLRTTEEMTENYRLLLAAENVKFRIGESSLFLVNSREQKLIDTQIKQAKLRATFQKIKIGLRQAAGVLK